MEITKSNLESDSSKKVIGSKSKLLYKFKISDGTPKKKLFMGQCFLVDLNLEKEKNISQSKSINKLNKLPSIILSDKSKITDSLTLQRSKSQNKRHEFKLNSIKVNKNKILKPLNSLDIYPPIKSNENLYTIQPETKNNLINDSFLKRINDLYYPKFTKIRYFTRLFEDNDKNDLKMIDLKKIKKPNNKIKYSFKKDNDNINNLLYYKKNKNKKINFDDKLNGKENIPYKLTKDELEKQLENFRKLKIKLCKNKVNETLNDLMRLRSKNSAFIENFKKSCDFKFDDDLLI